MTLKLKSTTNELWKGWKLAWYHHFTHIACAKKLRGLRQKWMHFRYKMDNLFWSIRVSDENSSVTKTFHFLNLFQLQIFCAFSITIQSHISNFQPFLTSFVLFQAFTHIFELNDHEIEKHYKWSLKRLKVGMVSSFHPHSMCKKVERVTAKKLDALRVQNGQSLSKYQGFIRKLVCYKGISFFLNLFEVHSFSVFKMHHSNPHHQFSTLSDFICYFSCIYWLFWAIRPWNWNAFQMNSEKVESWHGIIISPT